MSIYSAIEAPINQLIQVVSLNRGLSISKRVEITSKIKDISIQRHRIRIHPDVVSGADLLALVERVLELDEEFSHRAAARYHEQAIADTRKRVLSDMEYLFRSDPDSVSFILNIAHSHLLPRPKR